MAGISASPPAFAFQRRTRRMPPRWPRTVSAKSAIGAFASLVLLASVVRADIYSFVDADGTVHFTNVPSRDNRYRLYIRTHDRHKARLLGGTNGRRDVDGSDASGDSNADRFHRYDAFIVEAASLYQIPEELVRAVIRVESGYDAAATSSVGARGLMQLMPDTAERMQVRDIFDPRENILGGVRYLRILANLFNGDLELTLAGYNAGEGAVTKYGGIPPFAETQDYVIQVLEHYRRYRAAHESAVPNSAE